MGIVVQKPIEAAFQHAAGTEKKYIETKEVAAWTDEDGEPVAWVFDKDRLRRADQFANFVRLQESTTSFPATVLPTEPGWFVVKRMGDDPEKGWWSPVIAWAVNYDGYSVSALTAPQSSFDIQIERLEDDEKEVIWFDPDRDRNGGMGPWKSWAEVEDEPTEPAAQPAQHAEDSRERHGGTRTDA